VPHGDVAFDSDLMQSMVRNPRAAPTLHTYQVKLGQT